MTMQVNKQSSAVRISRGLSVVFLVFLQMMDFSYGWKPDEDTKETEFKVNGYTIEVWKTKDDYCPLDVTATYPYVVKLFDNKAQKILRQGVILSHQAVLTTASPLTGSREDYLVVAHRVYSIKAFNHKLCYQTRQVIGLHPHPKYTDNKTSSSYSTNFQILALDRQFDASPNFVYPFVFIYKSPYDFVQFVRRVTVIDSMNNACELPRLDNINSPAPYLNQDTIYYENSSLTKFGVEPCWVKICQVAGETDESCTRFKTPQNYTLICAAVDKSISWYEEKNRLGSPLICNGSIAGLVVAREDWKTTQDTSMLVVATFVRIWPWLMSNKDIFWNTSFGRKEWDSEFLEDHRLYFKAIDRLYRNKNVTVEGSRIKFISKKDHHGYSRSRRIDFSIKMISIGLLMLVLML